MPVAVLHPHQVLGCVVGVRRRRAGVRAADVVRVVLLQHVAARRLRHDDVVARTGSRRRARARSAARPSRTGRRRRCARYGAPQHVAPSTSEHSSRCARTPARASWPIAGSWYSTRHVGNTATRPCRLVIRTFGRCANHVENRCRANGGSSRWLDTPVTFSTSRAHERIRRARRPPGWRRSASTCADLADQVRPPDERRWSQRSRAADVPGLVPHRRRRAASAAGSRSPTRAAAGVYGQLTAQQLALEALVDHLVLLRRA